ncbi:MAG: ATP-grasp domain-containing protein, partial [Bacteroidota bacterium]
DKLSAKEAVKAYDIPMVPGIEEAITDVNLAKEIAERIGFPILIKASAGGGGKGMRVVEDMEELPGQMDRAISEATSAFGNGSVFIEKYVSSPRHIEIQVLADTQGNTLHLFERECSIQRRHQKVVEEAPSAVLTPELREEMGQAAVRVAKACDYVGAGTVEFLLDADKNFYFLEMNTRLQVEHPVTELVTGLDLVEQQIIVAQGEALSFQQSDLQLKGHALELRVYAEDPMDNFLPSVGTLETYISPQGAGIRLDDAYEEGMEIPIYYDPMIAKLITYGATRTEAIQRMKEAIAQYQIEGIATTLPFGSYVCDHPAFVEGNFDTHFVKTHYSPEKIIASQEAEKKLAAMLAVKLFLDHKKKLSPLSSDNENWRRNRTR